MVRNFDPDRAVHPTIIERILSNALRAPSAGFSQGWGFLLLDDPPSVRRFWEATGSDLGAPDNWLRGMSRAPVLIIACSNKSAYLDRYALEDKGWTDRDESRWPVPYWDIDTGMAVLLMLQTVTDEGLGSCFFGIPPERLEQVRREFGIPEEYQPIGVVAVGHRAPDARSPSLRLGRKSTDQVVHRGQWGNRERAQD